MLILATNASKTMINTMTKMRALQHVNYVKLAHNLYLDPRDKSRTHKLKTTFIRHLKDKVGKNQHISNT